MNRFWYWGGEKCGKREREEEGEGEIDMTNLGYDDCENIRGFCFTAANLTVNKL